MNKIFLFHHKGIITLGPHSYLKPALQTNTFWLFMFLLPQILMLFITKSFDSVLIITASVLASASCEAIDWVTRKKASALWISSVLQGILIGMLLPSSYPLLAVFPLVFFSLMLTKYAFGGFASSWVNPVAITVAVAYFLYEVAFPGFQIGMAELQGKNPALSLIQSGAVSVLPVDSAITSFLNKSVFKFFGMAIPDGYVSLFWDSGSVIPAFRFNFITLISSIVLISLDMVEVPVMSSFIVVYLALVRVLEPVFVQGIPFQGDMILALLTGGTLFCTLFVLQWYGSIPLSFTGKIIYGIIAGVCAFFVMGGGTSPAGYVFTILLMNIVSPVIQYFEEKNVKRSVEKNLLPRLNLLKEAENV